MNTVLFGVDIGGTRIRAGLIEDGLRCTHRRIRSTPQAQGPDPESAFLQLINGISGDIRDMRGQAGAASAQALIGVAVPGLVDTDRGVVLRSVNLPFCEGRGIAARLAESCAAQVRLCTDIQAATWAEYRACGATSRPFGHLRLGTGVGYAEIRQDRFVVLPRGAGRHLDVLRIASSGDRRCLCGLDGCLEAYVSRAAFTRYPPLGPEAREPCIASLREVLARLLERLGPEGKLVVGGGLPEEFPFLADAVAAAARESSRCGTLSLALCGDDAGLIGAAALACRGGLNA